MKKKVLLALIALVSFATSWAATEGVEVSPEGKTWAWTFSLDKDPVGVGGTLPRISSVIDEENEPLTSQSLQNFSYSETPFKLEEGEYVASTTAEPGNYYLKAHYEADTEANYDFYIPFSVSAVIVPTKPNADESTFVAGGNGDFVWDFILDKNPIKLGDAFPVVQEVNDDENDPVDMDYVTTDEKAYTLGANGYEEVENVTTVGTYYRKVTFENSAVELVFYVPFKVESKNIPITAEDVTVTPESNEYSGTKQEPTVKVTVDGQDLTAGTDYEITWAYAANAEAQATGDNAEDFTEAGIYTATIVGQGNYVTADNGIPVSYTITPASAAADVEIVANDVVYTGTNTAVEVFKLATLDGVQGPTNFQRLGEQVKFISVDPQDEEATEEATEEEPVSNDNQGEISNPNHVGTWVMVISYPADANHKAAKAYSNEFEVLPATMQMNLGIINWVYGKDYPEVKKPYFNIPQSEYQPGDGENNVTIEEAGYVQPYEGLTDEFLPVGTGYKWSLQQGVQPKAVTTIAGEEYQNYIITANNNSAMLNIASADLAVGVTQASSDKIYGYEDPEFVPTFTIASNIYFKEYPIVEVEEGEEGYIDTDELSEEELDAYNAEKAMIEAIAADIVITRDGGVGTADYGKKEDVGFYDFNISFAKGSETAKNYKVDEEGDAPQFEIKPYDITPREAIAAVADDPATADVDESEPAKPADNKDKFQITVADVTYTGKAQTPAYTVKFAHAVLGNLDLYVNGYEKSPAVADDPATTDVDESKAAVIANDYTIAWENNTNVSRNKDDYSDVLAKGELTITAHNWGETPEDREGQDGLNRNFKGVKSANFKVNPQPLKLIFRKDLTKVYGANDPAIEPLYEGAVNDEDPTLDAFWTNSTVEPATINKPIYKREAGEDVGQYTISCINPGTSNNYTVTFEPGLLTITGATLTITPDPKGKSFGTADPEKFTYTVDGLKFSDTFDYTLDLFERVDGEAVGTYEIRAKADAPTSYTSGLNNKTNYSAIVYNTAVFTISTGEDQLYLIADDNSKVYGQNDPTLTYHAELLKGFDEETGDPIFEDFDLTDQIPEGYSITVKRAEGEDATRAAEGLGDENEVYYPINFVTTYTYTQNGRTYTTTYANNVLPDNIGGYKPIATPGRFSISKAELHVQPVAQAIKYGQDPQYDLELTVDNNGKTDLKNNDQWLGANNVKAQVLATLDKTKPYSGYPTYDEDGEIAQDGPGTYTITISGGDIKNYIVHYVPGTLTVTASGLIIYALDQNVNYPAPVNGVYSTPEANLVPVVGVKDGKVVNANGTIGVIDTDKVLPADFDYSSVVELSCTATAAGTNEGAITIAVKDDVTDYAITLDNPNNAVVDEGEANLTVNPLKEIHLAYTNVDQALEDHKGYKMDKVYLPNRQLKADQWYTFVLPFEFNVPELSYELYYGVVDVLDETKNDANFHFNLTIGTIEANQPFLLKVAASPARENEDYAVTREMMQEIYFENKTIGDGDFAYNDLENSPARVDNAGNAFIGQYTGVAAGELTSADRIMSNGEFGSASPTATLRPTVGYLEYPTAEAAANGRIYIEEADGTTTVISGVEFDGEAIAQGAAEGWYTIGGAKLNGKPAMKGVYIHNGKKVSIK